MYHNLSDQVSANHQLFGTCTVCIVLSAHSIVRIPYTFDSRSDLWGMDHTIHNQLSVINNLRIHQRQQSQIDQHYGHMAGIRMMISCSAVLGILNIPSIQCLSYFHDIYNTQEWPQYKVSMHPDQYSGIMEPHIAHRYYLLVHAGKENYRGYTMWRKDQEPAHSWNIQEELHSITHIAWKKEIATVKALNYMRYSWCHQVSQYKRRTQW